MYHRPNIPMDYMGDRAHFQSTYMKSYKPVNTLKESPVYSEFRKHGYDHLHLPYNAYEDHSMDYPDPRHHGERRHLHQMHGHNDGMRSHRSRFEDAQMQRHENQDRIQYREKGRSVSPDSPRERHEPHSHRQDRPVHNMDEQRNRLAFENQQTHNRTFVQCTKCLKDNRCVNKLGCSHQYCDECMARLPGCDSPFRDSMRWHFVCEMPWCKKMTAESKLLRLDQFGQRVVMFQDMWYFSSE